MTFSHNTVSVNGIQMHYVIGGHGDPVVLLHGWPETWYEAQSNASFSKELHCYCT
jgi:pimeloyl-ACP methyl ester carboxylesterase